MWRYLSLGVIAVFAALYAIALLLFASGAVGLFGQDAETVATFFLTPLGSPWSKTVGYLPAMLGPVVLMLAPALNLLILWVLLKPKGRPSARA
jgi:hypothetical protein